MEFFKKNRIHSFCSREKQNILTVKEILQHFSMCEIQKRNKINFWLNVSHFIIFKVKSKIKRCKVGARWKAWKIVMSQPQFHSHANWINNTDLNVNFVRIVSTKGKVQNICIQPKRNADGKSEQKNKNYEINIRNKMSMQRHSKIAFRFAHFFALFFVLRAWFARKYLFILSISVFPSDVFVALIFFRCSSFSSSSTPHLLFRAHVHKWLLLTFLLIHCCELCRKKGTDKHIHSVSKYEVLRRGFFISFAWLIHDVGGF